MLPAAALATAALAAIPWLPASTAGEDSCFSTLSQLQWRYRVLTIRTEDGAAARRLLEAHAPALEERDVLWLVQASGVAFSNADRCVSPTLWSSAFPLPGAEPSVTLRGKDGGVKLRRDSLDMAEIFSRIDAMPMRRREMEQRR
jgi:hypothetical protein